MNKIAKAVAVSLLAVPCVAVAQGIDLHINQLQGRYDATQNKKIKKNVQTAVDLVTLSEEGKVFEKEISFFRDATNTYLEHNSNVNTTEQVNHITQQLATTADAYKAYEKAYAKNTERGILERKVLLFKLAQPIQGVDWVNLVSENANEMTHYYTEGDKIKDFVQYTLIPASKLSKEGKALEEEISFFRNATGVYLNDSKDKNDKAKVNHIVQQLVTTLDAYEKYNKTKTGQAPISRLERDLLLHKLAQPIDGFDWVKFSHDNAKDIDSNIESVRVKGFINQLSSISEK